MKVKRKIIEINEELCDGCGQCVPGCAEGALRIVDGKAKMVDDKYCDGLGACVGECPNGALKIIERDSEEFDEVAVEKHLKGREAAPSEAQAVLPCGCPSANIQTFSMTNPCESANRPTATDKTESALTHWPVQIRLVPASAPFLKGADLLVVADCVPVAFPTLHQDFLKGKAVLIGCPKFDDVQEYIARFADIFKQADIRSVTTLVMEVPCCAGLPVIVKKGMEAAGKNIPMAEVVISPRGKILNKDHLQISW